MLASLKRMLSRVRAADAPLEVSAAVGSLTEIPEPKVSNKQTTKPSHSKRARTATSDQKLSQVDRRTANTDLLTLRNGTSTKSTIRDLAKVSPDLSSSVWAYQRLVVTRNFRAVAYNHDGTAHPQATEALQQVISRMNYLGDYTDGFSGMSTLHAAAEAMALELRIEGSCSGELVLDKARLPSRIQPISTSQIEFYEDKTGYVYPVQRVNGEEINLDIPTFFYEALDQDLLQAYSDSPMEAAVQAVIADTEFTNDVRRTIKRALHPRLKAVIQSEEFRKSMPNDVRGDPIKEEEYRNQFIASVAETMNGLEPDDVLVSFDSIEFDYLNNGNVTLNKEWETLQGMTNAKLATGTKAPPAVLGHGSGSQNVASTETMLFVRYCEGVQQKLNSILSRMFTLAVRLMGHDVYVHFEFDRIDLRPDSELEAFRSMKQERVLEQLSFGLITDEQACLELTGRLPPPGMPKLSGTMFTVNKVAQGSANGFSNTSNGQGQGAAGADQKSESPEQSKGPAVKRVK
jgi:hypothetical protein